MRNKLLNSGRSIEVAAREAMLLVQHYVELVLNLRNVKVPMRYKRWQVKSRKDFFVMIKNYKR